MLLFDAVTAKNICVPSRFAKTLPFLQLPTNFAKTPSQRYWRFCGHKSWGRKMPKISWPPKQLPLSTSGNWDHWCVVWQVHCPFFEWSFEETCWCVWRPQGAPVAPPASVPGCGQGKCCQHIWPVCKFDLILPVVFLTAFNVLTTITAYHLPLYQCVAIAFRILVLSLSFIYPQFCSVTLCIG